MCCNCVKDNEEDADDDASENPISPADTELGEVLSSEGGAVGGVDVDVDNDDDDRTSDVDQSYQLTAEEEQEYINLLTTSK